MHFPRTTSHAVSHRVGTRKYALAVRASMVLWHELLLFSTTVAYESI